MSTQGFVQRWWSRHGAPADALLAQRMHQELEVIAARREAEADDAAPVIVAGDWAEAT